VDVPAEKEGGVATEGEGSDEGIVVWTKPEFDEGELSRVSIDVINDFKREILFGIGASEQMCTLSESLAKRRKKCHRRGRE
jgi:hypothetical protein